MKPYIEIINYLNTRAGTGYRATASAHQRHINARLREGYTLQDFYKVIDVKCKEWMGTNWQKYLRPETLFGTKFDSYLNQNETTDNQEELFRATDYYKAI